MQTLIQYIFHLHMASQLLDVYAFIENLEMQKFVQCT